LSTRKDNEDQKVEGYDNIFSATGLGPKLFLDSLTIDSSFTTVWGVFPDDHFIDYLHQQENVEYVEANQVYKAQMLHPLQDYILSNNTMGHTYLQRVNELAVDKKKRGTIQTASAPNWGQARITQRVRGDMSQYTYNESAGYAKLTYNKMESFTNMRFIVRVFMSMYWIPVSIRITRISKDVQ
jgi:hypothetical protein